MVRKSTKQIIKQSVNVRVHVGDSKKKKNGRRRKRGGGSGGGSGSSMPQQQLYNPVYIQSGTPSESDNPLHRAIRDLNDKVDRQFVEHKVVNPLLNMVANEGKGHAAEHKSTIKTPVNRTPAKTKALFGDEIPSPSSRHTYPRSDSSDTPSVHDRDYWLAHLRHSARANDSFSGSNPMHSTTQLPSPPIRITKNKVWKVGDPVPVRNARGRKSAVRQSYEDQNPGKSEN